MACVDIEILFVIFLRDLKRSDELRQQNQFLLQSKSPPPPPNPSLVPYIWDLQTSVTVISLARVPQKIIHPIYTKNVH